MSTAFRRDVPLFYLFFVAIISWACHIFHRDQSLNSVHNTFLFLLNEINRNFSYVPAGRRQCVAEIKAQYFPSYPILQVRILFYIYINFSSGRIFTHFSPKFFYKRVWSRPCRPFRVAVQFLFKWIEIWFGSRPNRFIGFWIRNFNVEWVNFFAQFDCEQPQKITK